MDGDDRLIGKYEQEIKNFPLDGLIDLFNRWASCRDSLKKRKLGSQILSKLSKHYFDQDLFRFYNVFENVRLVVEENFYREHINHILRAFLFGFEFSKHNPGVRNLLHKAVLVHDIAVPMEQFGAIQRNLITPYVNFAHLTKMFYITPPEFLSLNQCILDVFFALHRICQYFETESEYISIVTAAGTLSSLYFDIISSSTANLERSHGILSSSFFLNQTMQDIIIEATERIESIEGLKDILSVRTRRDEVQQFLQCAIAISFHSVERSKFFDELPSEHYVLTQQLVACDEAAEYMRFGAGDIAPWCETSSLKKKDGDITIEIVVNATDWETTFGHMLTAFCQKTASLNRFKGNTRVIFRISQNSPKLNFSQASRLCIEQHQNQRTRLDLHAVEILRKVENEFRAPEQLGMLQEIKGENSRNTVVQMCSEIKNTDAKRKLIVSITQWTNQREMNNAE